MAAGLVALSQTHTSSGDLRDSDGCELLWCRELWPLYEDPWGYFSKGGGGCTYCARHYEPWLFFTQALLFPVIRYVLVMQLGRCGWDSGAEADTE